MNGRWFYVDGVLTEIRGSESSIREQVSELEREHSRVKPARAPRVVTAAEVRAAGHRRSR
jgi:hypothetical protein